MKTLLLSVVAAGLAWAGHAQLHYTPYTFVTLAGNGEAGSTDGPAASARFNGPSGLAIDTSGALYVADGHNGTIRKITPDGMVSTVAGKAGEHGSTDGPASAARFSFPRGMALDLAGNLYVVEGGNGNDIVRKITPDGMVSTLVGTPGKWGWTDGLGSQAGFFAPNDITIGEGGILFVTDNNNFAVRRITPEGWVTTFAGKTSVDFQLHMGSADGTGSNARFDQPCGIDVDAAGNLFVADSANGTIRRITPDAVVTTFAGKAGQPHSDPIDGPGDVARFKVPHGIAVDVHGNVFVTERASHTIRRITPTGEVTTVAGASGMPGGDDGTGAQARFYHPGDIAVDKEGCLYVAEYMAHRIRKGWPATAPKLSRPEARPDGSVQLEVTGVAGSSYRIEASMDLADWVPVAVCKSTDSSTLVALPAPANSANKFYRAVLE